jgi:hypothetical protein
MVPHKETGNLVSTRMQKDIHATIFTKAHQGLALKEKNLGTDFLSLGITFHLISKASGVTITQGQSLHLGFFF